MSGILKLLPVILLLLVVAGAAYVGYQIYLYTNTLAERGQRHMAKKNISFSADGGMRVGVKELGTEEYSQKTQNVIVNAWNLSSWPEYKSRYWNKDAEINKRHQPSHSRSDSPSAAKAAAARPAAARHASSR